MDTRQLEYILAIAEEKSLSRAAERLFLSQSALSQQLAKLDAEGLPPLFIRQKGKMELTDAGKIYINGARSILKLKSDAEHALKNLDSDKIHHLRIAVCRLFQPLYYKRILPWLKHSYPDTGITLSTPHVGHVRHMVENGEIDLVLIASEGDFNEILHYVPLQQEEIVLATTPSLTGIQLPLALPAKGTHLRRLCDRALTSAGLQPPLYAEPEDISWSIELCKLGECCALLPRSLAAASGLAAQSLSTPYFYQNAAIIKKGTASPMLDEICEWLKYLFQEKEDFICRR